MESLQIVLVFAPVGVGFLLGRFRKTDPEPLADTCLYFLMAILMFSALVRTPLTPVQAAEFVSWYFAFVLVAWALTALVTGWLGRARPTRGALALSMSSVNEGSYGVPVVLFAVGESALGGIMLLFACSNIAAGSIGVYIAAGGRKRPAQALASVFKLPLIYAVILALAVRALDLQLPPRALALGQQVGMAGPTLGLVILGIQISRMGAGEGRELPLIWVSIGAKLILGPVLGIGLITLFGIQAPVRDTLLICSCLPTAINCLLLAVKYDTHPRLVGAILVGSPFLSPLTIAAPLLLFGD